MCRERKYGCVSFAKDEWTRETLPGCDMPDVNQCRTRLYLFPVIFNWTFWVSGLTRFLPCELRGEVSFHTPCHANYSAKALMHSATAKSLMDSVCFFGQNLPSLHNVWMFFISAFISWFSLKACCHWHSPPAARNEQKWTECSFCKSWHSVGECEWHKNSWVFSDLRASFMVTPLFLPFTYSGYWLRKHLHTYSKYVWPILLSMPAFDQEM